MSPRPPYPESLPTAPGRARAGRAPSGPADLPAREWLAVARGSLRGFLADDALGLAQQIAYSSLLAFFPAAIFLVGLLDLIGGYDELRAFLAPIAPSAVLETIDTLQRETSTGASAVAFVAGAAGALWAASGAMSTVLKAVNRAYGGAETRPFWETRLLAALLVVLVGLVTAGVLTLVVFGGPLGTAIAASAGLGEAFELVWSVLRWPLAFAAILLFFALVYFLAPDVEERSFRWVTPGSLAGALAWLALSGLFALYTSLSDAYARTYGALSAGIVLLLWLNYSAFALLWGAELNAAVARAAERRAAHTARPSPDEAGEDLTRV